MNCAYCNTPYKELSRVSCVKCGAPRKFAEYGGADMYCHDLGGRALTMSDMDGAFSDLYSRGIYDLDVLMDGWGYWKSGRFYEDWKSLERDGDILYRRCFHPLTGQAYREYVLPGFERGKMKFMVGGVIQAEIKNYSTSC